MAVEAQCLLKTTAYHTRPVMHIGMGKNALFMILMAHAKQFKAHWRWFRRIRSLTSCSGGHNNYYIDHPNWWFSCQQPQQWWQTYKPITLSLAYVHGVESNNESHFTKLISINFILAKVYILYPVIVTLWNLLIKQEFETLAKWHHGSMLFVVSMCSTYM